MTLFRHVASGTTQGEVWSFTLHTEGSNTIDSAQAGFSSSMDSFWTGGLDAFVSTTVALTETSTASIDEGTGHQITRVNDDVEVPGVATGESLPYQCATAVSTRTALATRSGRGRFYLPPLAVSVMDAGRLSDTAQAGILAAAEALFAGLATAGLAPVLFNRASKATTPITRIDVGNVIDTQRRRRNKLIEVRLSADL